jgi:hypothetical protein
MDLVVYKRNLLRDTLHDKLQLEFEILTCKDSVVIFLDIGSLAFRLGR